MGVSYGIGQWMPVGPFGCDKSDPLGWFLFTPHGKVADIDWPDVRAAGARFHRDGRGPANLRAAMLADFVGYMLRDGCYQTRHPLLR